MANPPESSQRRELPGSDRAATPGAAYAGSVDPDEQIELTLVLRRERPLDDEAVRAAALTASELGNRYGASSADIEQVRDIITAAGGEVLRVDAPSRRMRVVAAAAVWTVLFGTELTKVRSPNPTTGELVEHRHRIGSLQAPVALADVVVAVLGLDDRPQARAHFRYAPGSGRQPSGAVGEAVAAAAVTASFTPLQLATAYQMPAGTDGTGQTIAIIELGGGFGTSDLTTYFKSLKLSPPKVTAAGVDGAKNEPGQDPDGADGEVLLDIEVAGAIAPKANIVVYFAPNTDAGFLDAIAEATHARPTPTAMSISWGQSEDQWTAQARTAMDQAFADAATIGVTVTVAAGDNGSSDATSGTAPHVDFPAASPHVLACGGTSLSLTRSETILSETVWNDGTSGGATGGGVSDTFAQPSWQSTAGVPVRLGTSKSGRGVPDVAGDADPRTGYQVYVDGQAQVIGGTSAVAPLWAGLVARLAQATGAKLGLLPPKLYAGIQAGRPATGLRDITSGSNGGYSAHAGWDACTGLGTPEGATLLKVLAGQ